MEGILDVRCQRSEVRCQKSDVRYQKWKMENFRTAEKKQPDKHLLEEDKKSNIKMKN